MNGWIKLHRAPGNAEVHVLTSDVFQVEEVRHLATRPHLPDAHTEVRLRGQGHIRIMEVRETCQRVFELMQLSDDKPIPYVPDNTTPF